jgi:hypothetical protein
MTRALALAKRLFSHMPTKTPLSTSTQRVMQPSTLIEPPRNARPPFTPLSEPAATAKRLERRGHRRAVQKPGVPQGPLGTSASLFRLARRALAHPPLWRRRRRCSGAAFLADGPAFFGSRPHSVFYCQTALCFSAASSVIHSFPSSLRHPPCLFAKGVNRCHPANVGPGLPDLTTLSKEPR